MRATRVIVESLAICYLFFGGVAQAEKRALLIGISDYLPPPGAHLPVEPGHALDSRFAPDTTWSSLSAPMEDVADMVVLLREHYDFPASNITVLPESEATHQGILDALQQLADKTKPGDLVLFYYSGHGSQRLDTLSSKNQRDQTIVPIDAWKKDPDVRDKELAVAFNRIVYDKHAHLTAIFDTCDSSTQARGLMETHVRALPYDDSDVAHERRNSPHPERVIVESDLKRIPQQGDAILLAAAGPEESAVEARYEDGRWHGAFTRALIRVLETSSQSISANDAVFAASSLMHADKVDFQQPSLEGKSDESLLGTPVPAHPMHVHVVAAADPNTLGSTWRLDIGSAGAFEVGSQFIAVETHTGSAPAVLEITSIDGPLASSAKLISGSTDYKPGAIFQMKKKVYPSPAKLAVFVSSRELGGTLDVVAVKAMFPGLRWVADPAVEPIDYLVVREESGWVAYNYVGQSTAASPTVKGRGFLVLPPPDVLLEQLKLHKPYLRGAYIFTTKLRESNYFLAVKGTANSGHAVALFDPVVLAPRNDPFVLSEEGDPDDARLNGGQNPQVACRKDISLPVRTAWLADSPNEPEGEGLSLAITRRLVRIGMLRMWLWKAATAPTMEAWPYRLATTQSGTDMPLPKTPLAQRATYDLRLLASVKDLATIETQPKFLYLIGFDCAANPSRLYPSEKNSGDDKKPSKTTPSVFLLNEEVTPPLGADSVFLLATPERNPDPDLLIADGDLTQGEERGLTGGMDDMNAFLEKLNSSVAAEPEKEDWTIQRVLVSSHR